MPGFQVAVFGGLCKKLHKTIQVSNCLFCAIEIVGEKYDIFVETMENLSHSSVTYTAQNQRKSIIC